MSYLVEKIAPHLQRVYRRSPICPVIVEAFPDRLRDVAAMLREMVPQRYLIPQIGKGPIISRLMEMVEFPLFSFKEIPTFNMVALPLYPDRIEEVAQWKQVKKIYLDRLMRPLQTLPAEEAFTDPLTQTKFTTTKFTKKMIGGDEANLEGYTGRGIVTAVLDTGARLSHPQLREAVILSAMKEKGGSGLDSCGHGTHCASTVGGLSVTDPVFKLPVEGMAPHCRLLSIQVLGWVVGAGSSSDVIEGMGMAMNSGSNIVSMSLGSDSAPPPEENPDCIAINALTEKGSICVVAAGNSGPGASTVGSPGCCEKALTVGAWDQFEGKVADFSSRGPVHGLTKPDLIAPGVNVYSGCVGLLDILTDKRQQHFSYMSGTSQSTPHVSGLLACAHQMFKEKYNVTLTVDLVKEIAERYGHIKDDASGWGMICWDWFKQYAREELG